MVSQENRLRYRSILIAREVKWLFCAVPERFLKVLLRRFLPGAVARWLFQSPEGAVTRAGEVLLADLREYSGLGRSAFNSDPLKMARIAGRQDVVLRIVNYLNLDEREVQKLMELDDGLE